MTSGDRVEDPVRSADTATSARSLVARKALELGEPGQRWLDGLPGLLAELTRQWALVIGDPLPGGSAGFVARVRRADGSRAVLKLAVPDGGFAAQAAVLRAADGHAYVRVLAHDDDHQALLLEELGPRLDATERSVEETLDVLTTMLRAAWAVPADVPAVAKAEQLVRLIDGLRDLGPDDVVERALALAARRAHDPGPPVVVHGDPHPGNALAAARAPAGYLFVDPEGFRTEAAYDLGVVLRDRSPELLAGDAPALLRRWCARIAGAAGADPDVVWEWAFVERVSTGLHLRSLGADEEGATFLAAATQLL